MRGKWHLYCFLLMSGVAVPDGLNASQITSHLDRVSLIQKASGLELSMTGPAPIFQGHTVTCALFFACSLTLSRRGAAPTAELPVLLWDTLSRRGAAPTSSDYPAGAPPPARCVRHGMTDARQDVFQRHCQSGIIKAILYVPGADARPHTNNAGQHTLWLLLFSRARTANWPG